MLKNKFIQLIILIAFVLRIFLSFSTYHVDLAALDYGGLLIKSGNFVNLYDHIATLPEGDPIRLVYPASLFIYPPLPYYYFGLVNVINALFVEDGLNYDFIVNIRSVLGNIQTNFLLLSLKLPYFIFDLAIAFILASLFKEEKQKRAAFIIWLFNPVSIYATYMMGQFDIIPTFLTVLAVYYATKSKFILSAILLGIGASFKVFPLLLILPLAFVVHKDFFQRLKLVFVGIATYLLTTYPYVFSQGFRSSAMIADHSTKSFFAQVPVSGGQSIILFLALVIFFYIVFYYKSSKIEDLWKRFFVMLLLFFVFTHYHPQWFVWITPFFIIDLIYSKFKHWPLVVASLFSFFGFLTFFDPSLTIGLFSAINPNLYNSLGLWQLIGLNLDINYARSLLHTLFVGVAIYYIYLYLFKEGNNENS